MNKLIKGLILATFIGVFAYQAAPVLAYNPSMYISGSTVTINGGQPNSSVVLTYTPAGSSLQTTITGSTDYNGNFTADVGSISGQVTATVGGQQVYQNGYNGGCTYNCGNPYGLSLSQNSLNLSVNQSSTVTIYNNNNYNYGSYYISSNSNSYVATASISGNQVNVYAQSDGSTSINICTNYGSGCVTLNVTVSGNTGCSYYGNCGGNITLSDTSVNLTSGQNKTLTIYNNSNYYYNNSYYIYSNSNSSIASASVSGNSLYIYGGYTTGSTSIKVCQTNNSNNCATVYVTVNGGNCGYYNCGGSLSLSQTNVSLSSGQSQTVTAYNNSGSLYVASNSNSYVASASISGSSINIYGSSNGNTNINICSTNGSQCATIYVTVGSGSNSSVWFSQSNINLTIGQSQSLNIYSYNYSGNYYISSNTYSGTVNANIVGNQLNLYGQSNGNSTITVCQSGNSNSCGTIYVNVTNNNCGVYGCSGSISLSQTSLYLTQNQSSAVYIYGGGSYYVSSNSNSGVASASVSGTQINVYAANIGTTNIQICQNYASVSCATLYVTVSNSGGTGSLYFSNATLPTMVVGQYYNQQLQVYGGTAPYTFTQTGGVLPNGLTLSSNGLLSGVPTGNASANFSVRVTDTYGRVGTANFSISGNGGGVLGSNTYSNGTLISEYGTVYITYKNLKTPFANAQAFTGLGYSFSNVMSVGSNNLINSGYTVSSSYVQHPWGSWIKSGNTVYFVHQSGLIAVPSWDIFINNGGSQDKIVNANAWDFQLSMQSAMIYNDYRLQ